MQDPNKLLKSAVDDIVHSINSDKMSPHDAVVKTAKAKELNVHFIKRACEVLNVALTYEHFRKNADARDADFPIVDASKVSAEIFDKGEPTLNQKKSEWFAGTMVEEEVPNFIKAKTASSHTDTFRQLMGQVEPTRTMSDAGICEKAGHARLNLQQHLDNCRTEVVGAKMELASKFASLINTWSLSPAARSSFAEFESQVFSKYGEAALPYVDMIYDTAKIKEARGEHDPKNFAFDDSKETSMFDALLEASSNYKLALDKTAQAAADLVEMEMKRADAYRMLAESNHATRNLTISEETKVAALQEEEQSYVDPVVEAANKKVADTKAAYMTEPSAVMEDESKYLSLGQRNLPPALKAKIIAHKKGAGASPLKTAGVLDLMKNEVSSLGTPQVKTLSDSPLDNLDRKLLVQNLMVSDPILKTYDPKRVGDAYEQFLRLAPELSLEKELVRSHLRNMAASQALTPFDGAQLVDANSKLLKQHIIERSGTAPKEEKR